MNREFLTYESWRDALRMNRWVIDAPMIPNFTYVQFIEDCYQRNLLRNSEMRIDSQVIDLFQNLLLVGNNLIPVEHLFGIPS